MQNRNLKKRMQKSIALASMAAFLMMPGSMAFGVNNITAGNSGVGSLTTIGGTSTNTTITSNFVKNGTGINHFGQFNIGEGGSAKLLNATRYVNMVDGFANINGILNAINKGTGSAANVMFITPEGMAIGAKGQMNVAGFQLITPNATDYANLIKKAGAVGTAADAIELSLTDIETIKAGGEGYFQLGGKIYSTDDVVISTGNGIWFQDGGIINTTGSADGLGNISLFTNTGEILGGNTVHLDAAGNITMDGLGIAGSINGAGKLEDASVFGNSTVVPFNVKVANGKTLNVKVADKVKDGGSIQGYASVTNNSTNLKLGDVKGADVTITNNGNGTIATSKDINAVDKIYLNAKNGGLDVANNITAKNIVRLNGKVYADVSGDVNVTDAGYISVYSSNGDVSVANASLKSGNIDIKSAKGDVEVGNITITERGNAEGVLGLKDNSKLSIGVKAPDTYRFDGVHIEATNGNVSQIANTKINSAGRVDLTASEAVYATVKANDLISAKADVVTNLNVLDTARLGDITTAAAIISGENILVDGKINAEAVNIKASDKVTIRPRHLLDAENGHYTYGSIQGTSLVKVSAENGIFATEAKTDAPMIQSTEGKVNLVTPGDIGDDIKISVAAGEMVNADGTNVNLVFTGNKGNVGTIVAAENANIDAVGTLWQASEGVAITSGEDMVLTSQNANVGAPEQYITVEVGGLLSTETPNGGAYIASPSDLSVLNAVAGTDVAIVTPEALTVSKVQAGNDVILAAGKDLSVATVKAGNDVGLGAVGNITVANIVEAGNDILAEADGYIHQAMADKTSFKSGNDLTLNSANNNVGDPNQYLKVEVDGLLSAEAPNGGVYIYGNSDLNVLNATAGNDVEIKTPNHLTISKVTAGNDIVLNSDKNIVVATAKATNDVIIDAIGNVSAGNIIEAGNNLTITADGNIHQTSKGKTSFKSGKNMTFNSANKNVGDPNKYLYVQVGEALNAEALNGGVYIAGAGDLKVDKVEAGKNVGLKAEGNLHQIAAADPENPRIISGGNMKLESDKINVGDPENYLQVKVGGQLDAAAPNGGVYIGSKDNIVIGQVAAGKNVGIESEGFIHQTDAGARPAIIAGEDLHLLSKADNVGDPNNYLTVQVGDKLDAAAPNGGVYIYGYGDLTIDKIEAGEDVGIGGNKDIIIPHDREEGNIIAGGNVKIEAGDNVLNGGGENVGIVSGGDIEIIANLNPKENPSSIGELPYNDLSHSINVTLKGEVKADEVGVPEANKILNIHIMGTETNNDVVVDNNTNGNYEMDDRDQRNLKYLAEDDNNDASVRNNRQHLRYNVNNSEYILMNSSSESGAKVKDVLNISKQGMLVETDELAKVGENIQVTMDYKGLPFTVEGKVVRADATNKTAGVEFTNVDRMTSSLILYLGMMNGK